MFLDPSSKSQRSLSWLEMFSRAHSSKKIMEGNWKLTLGNIDLKIMFISGISLMYIDPTFKFQKKKLMFQNVF